jgi:hypothetical protein
MIPETPVHDSFLDPAGLVRPSPGSTAWPKACAGCALRRGDPQILGPAVQEDLRDECRSGWLEFYCVHREDASGRHRACASAEALRRGAFPDRRRR